MEERGGDWVKTEYQKYQNLIIAVLFFILQIKLMWDLSKIDRIDSVFSGLIFLSFFIFGYNVLKFHEDLLSFKSIVFLKFIAWLIKLLIFIYLWIFLVVFIKSGIFVVPFTYFGVEMPYIYGSAIWGTFTNELIQRFIQEQKTI